MVDLVIILVAAAASCVVGGFCLALYRVISDGSPKGQVFNKAAVAGGWAAIPVLFMMTWLTWPYTDASGVGWIAVTLAVVVVIGVMMAAGGIDAVRTARADAPNLKGDHLGHVLGAGTWLCGGLFNLVFLIITQGDICAGTDYGSFACVHRPGHLLNALGVVVSISATPVLVVQFWIGRRSQVAAWLTPPVIAGMYLLALCLWKPHAGLGVPVRPCSPEWTGCGP